MNSQDDILQDYFDERVKELRGQRDDAATYLKIEQARYEEALESCRAYQQHKANSKIDQAQ